jgi:CBS domain-containing protein
MGIITDRDIALRVASAGDAAKVKVRDVMTGDPFCAYEGQTIAQACRLMEKNKVRRLLVLNQAGELSGVLSLDDLAVKTNDTGRPAKVLRKTAAVSHR